MTGREEQCNGDRQENTTRRIAKVTVGMQINMVESRRKCPRKQSKVVTFYVASYWFSVAQQVVPGLELAVPELFRG